ncbi:MAG: hypothetical protein KDD43_12640, partial [Bdellovibrionales bacterium]|nr:hypothetical protein [Bdellovibrionales bacterium]
MRTLIKAIWILCAVSVAFFSQDAFARGMMGMGVSSGVVWQNAADTTRLNSAQTRMAMKNLDLAGGFGSDAQGGNGGYEAALSFVGSGKTVGYGLGVTYVPNDGAPDNGIQAIGALGVGGQKFGIGVGLQYQVQGAVQTDDLQIDIGTHFGGMDGFGFGANVINLTGGTIFINTGLGFRKAGSFHFELDGLLNLDSTTIDLLTLNIVLELGKGKFDLGVGYSADPDDLGGGDVLAGMHWWASPKFGIG